MDTIERESDMLQAMIDATLGPHYSDGLGPKLVRSRICPTVVTCFIDLGTHASFDLLERRMLRDERQMVLIVRARLLDAYRNMRDVIDATITHLEGKN